MTGGESACVQCLKSIFVKVHNLCNSLWSLATSETGKKNSLTDCLYLPSFNFSLFFIGTFKIMLGPSAYFIILIFKHDGRARSCRLHRAWWGVYPVDSETSFYLSRLCFLYWYIEWNILYFFRLEMVRNYKQRQIEESGQKSPWKQLERQL